MFPVQLNNYIEQLLLIHNRKCPPPLLLASNQVMLSSTHLLCSSLIKYTIFYPVPIFLNTCRWKITPTLFNQLMLSNIHFRLHKMPPPPKSNNAIEYSFQVYYTNTFLIGSPQSCCL